MGEGESRVAQNLAAVRRRIAAACEKIGRDAEDVRLVAVTKTHPIERVREAYAAGQRDFAENYVQDLGAKVRGLADLGAAKWRLIGHLQRNKAKDVVALGVAVDSVDSVKLAEAIAKRAEAEKRRIDVLLQVNVGGEPQKSGCTVVEVDGLVKAVRAMDSLDLQGLMTVPPLGAEPEASRAHFHLLRQLAVRHGLDELSMGMSHDLEIAIEEGATMVRIGTAIFGARD